MEPRPGTFFMRIFLAHYQPELPVCSELDNVTSSECKPVDRVVFLKTHKTGSSTITNILNRFADLRELLVALPIGGVNRFMWPNPFHWTSVDLLRLNGETANILCNHARYERAQMDLIMKSSAKYITILRDPVTQFHSSFYYFEVDKALGLADKKDPVAEFLRDPDKHLYDLSIRNGDLPAEIDLIQNGMLYDLGYDFLEFKDEAAVSRAVEKLGRELDLVMLMEYFDESLVLLMRELCWAIDDILYIKMNQMKYKKRTIAEGVKREIREWNYADVTLYSGFNRTFWNKVKKHGKEFWKDLAEFKRRNREMLRICGPEEVEEKGFKSNVTIKMFKLKSKLDRFHRFYCKKMAMDEVGYLEYFREKFGPSNGYQKVLKRDGLAFKATRELINRIKKKNKHIMWK
eukprot:gene15007-16556_t